MQYKEQERPNMQYNSLPRSKIRKVTEEKALNFLDSIANLKTLNELLKKPKLKWEYEEMGCMSMGVNLEFLDIKEASIYYSLEDGEFLFADIKTYSEGELVEYCHGLLDEI